MKQTLSIVLISLFLFSASHLKAQGPKKETSAKDVNDVVLKNYKDSLTYMLGVYLSQLQIQAGIEEMDYRLLQKAASDYKTGEAKINGYDIKTEIQEQSRPYLYELKTKNSIEAYRFINDNMDRPELNHVKGCGILYKEISVDDKKAKIKEVEPKDTMCYTLRHEYLVDMVVRLPDNTLIAKYENVMVTPNAMPDRGPSFSDGFYDSFEQLKPGRTYLYYIPNSQAYHNQDVFTSSPLVRRIIPPSSRVICEVKVIDCFEKWISIYDSKRSEDGDGNFLGASYPGGDYQMNREIQSALVYPEKAKADKIKGRVDIGATVEADGSLSRICVIKGIGKAPEMDAAAIEAVKKLKLFNPALENNKPVRSVISIQVRFTLP